MGEIFRLIVGVLVLILGIPIGNYLAKITREELKSGRRYFKILIYLGLIGGFVGLVIKNDSLLFSMFFISIVTSRSLIKKKPGKKNGKN